MIKIELKRAFSRISFKISILLVFIICILSNKDLLTSYIKGYANADVLTNYINGYVDTPFSHFIFFCANPVSNLLIIILPVISALSFADSYIEDMKSGFAQNIYVRKTRYKYLISKYFANFIVGGVTLSLPLLIDYFFCIMLRPNVQPDAILTGPIIMQGGLFSSLFYSHAHLYTIMWIIIYFLYSGVFASIALCVSKLIKNKFIVIFIPFILLNLFACFCEIINKMNYSPMTFLYIALRQSFSVIVGEFIIMFIITFSIFCFCGVKNDVYKYD